MAYEMQGAPQSRAIDPGALMGGMKLPMAPMGGMQPPQMQMPQPEPRDESTPVDKMLEQINIADHLSDEVLEKMGQEVHDGYKRDLMSKEAWDAQVDEWVKLAAQIKETKSFPWPNASNVRYPLLATAAMQFAARAYPSLVPADGKVVQFRVVGADPEGQKALKADKLAAHMNYQLLKDMEDWEEEMDRLLIMLPVVGCLFKKTYFDPIKKKNVSKLIGPKDLVVNYWATSLEATYRKTEIIPMTKNRLKEFQNAGIYREIEDLPEPQTLPNLPSKSDSHGNAAPSMQDATTPYVVLEQHTFWDLDDDGYAEPYIITIEEQSKEVLRVVARFDSDGIQEKEGKVICIEPVEYYTKYGFVPNPDGGFYDIGFGHLLGHINESVNTIVNQLIDAGTLANLQAGFLGKGIRIKLGETRFQPGEWKQVNATGDDIRKQVFPLPVNPPSTVLFQLLEMLITSGKELASVAEIFTGKMPGQNTPATTTQTTVEQGMKVFTAIYKRTYRSLSKEFEKVFRLNSLYDENFEKAQLILDEPISKEDYNRKLYDVCPTADPTAVSSTQKQLKAEMLMRVIPLGLNMDEVKKRVLEAQEQPNIKALLMNPDGQPAQPPPDPKVAQVQAKAQGEQAKIKADIQGKQEDRQMEAQFKQMEMQMDARERAMNAKYDEMERKMEFMMKEREFQQKTMQSAQQHDQKMTQTMEKAHVDRAAREVAGVEKASGNGSGGTSNPRKNRRSKS